MSGILDFINKATDKGSPENKGIGELIAGVVNKVGNRIAPNEMEGTDEEGQKVLKFLSENPEYHKEMRARGINDVEVIANAGAFLLNPLAFLAAYPAITGLAQGARGLNMGLPVKNAGIYALNETGRAAGDLMPSTDKGVLENTINASMMLPVIGSMSRGGKKMMNLGRILGSVK
jgi:hypothetical protein